MIDLEKVRNYYIACGQTVNSKSEIRIAAGNVVIADFCQIYHRT